MDNKLESVKNYIQEIESEIAVMKMVVESSISKGHGFVPMVVFYSNSTTKEFVVAPESGNTFDSKMKAISEVLHLYSAANCHAAIVSFTIKAEINDQTYDLVNMYALSSDNAYVIQIPFLVEDNKIEWQNDMFSCTSIDELETDSIAKNVLSMFYHFTHIENPGFTAEELMSYLSFKGAQIAQMNSKYKYIDFSMEDTNEDSR